MSELQCLIQSLIKIRTPQLFSLTLFDVLPMLGNWRSFCSHELIISNVHYVVTTFM
jgi:hypothetical protein